MVKNLRATLHLRLDESQQVLLVHAARVMVSKQLAIELRMAHQHLRPKARRVGQAREVDRRTQVVLTQRALAYPSTPFIRRVQTRRLDQHVRRYRTQ